MPKSFDRMGLAGNFECNVCVQWKRKCRYGFKQRWLVSSEFQVAFLSRTYYYTNVKPYFTLEWLKPLSLPHTFHKPRSYCWRQNHILLYCNKQSLEFGISTWYQHVTSSFFWQKKTSIYSKPSFSAWSWWAKDMARKGSPTIDQLTDVSSDFLPS